MPKTTPRDKRVAMGVAIVFWRRKRKLKQKELAEQCGWRPPRISKYETGRAWPEDESVEILARNLGISPEDLRRTQKLLYDLMLIVEGKVGPDREPEVVTPEANLIAEAASWASMDLDERWKELHRLEGMVRALRDRLQQDTHKAHIHSFLEDGGKA